MYADTQAELESPKPTDDNELSTYLQHQAPSFEEFRAALRHQLETIAQVQLAATRSTEVEEYDIDEGEEEDSDYDSLDGDDWSDEDITAESDDSLTDVESEGQISECTSPVFESEGENHAQGEVEEAEYWTIRPLAPFLVHASTRLADT